MAKSEKVEYMCEVAYFLGANYSESVSRLNDLDIEDVALLCSVIVDDYYQDDYPYLQEFLSNVLTISYLSYKLDNMF